MRTCRELFEEAARRAGFDLTVWWDAIKGDVWRENQASWIDPRSSPHVEEMFIQEAVEVMRQAKQFSSQEQARLLREAIAARNQKN